MVLICHATLIQTLFRHITSSCRGLRIAIHYRVWLKRVTTIECFIGDRYKKLSYRRGTARRAVSVETVQNVTQMFVELHLISPATGE